MKKIFSIFITLFMLTSFSACNTGDNSPKKETNSDYVSEETAKKAEKEDFGLNDTAVFENLKVTATKLETSNGKDFFKPSDGNVFVGVNFEIENISEETQSVSSLLLFDVYADDVKCGYSVSSNVVFGDGTLDGEISPGKKLIGWYAVEVPQDWQQLEFEVKSDWLSNTKAKFVFTK